VKLGLAIRDVRDAELALAEELGAVGERHKADHDVFHITATLQRLARANLARLEPLAERYGTDVDPGDAPDGHGQTILARARVKASEAVGRRPEPALLLLRDLRALHLRYAEASIDWTLLEQGAKAARDAELLEVATACHEQTLRGMRWTVTRIKAAAPQALTS
jgi:hypothetical protein